MDFLDGDLFWDPMIPSLSNKDRAEIYRNKNKTLAKLHSVDYKKIGLEDYGKPGNYVARQVSRWSKQYRASETDDIEAMNNLIEWLPKNIPDDDETSIVHGDYRLDNMILKDNQVMGILDWELSTLGHPIADFSYHCLSWRTQEAFWDQSKLKELGIPNEREYMDMYCENTGKDLSKNWEFYMAFNMFKIAGILQGILGRVRDGTASSKHAEDRGMMVYPLSEAAWNTIKENLL
jgi:aminoglycoside phosphotransferase (APT) family kinase protein